MSEPVRLTRIALDGDSVVDLHPRLTVVRGLDADARHRLADAIGGLPEGTTRGLSGWVELDGARRELGPEVLEGFGVPEDSDLVVRAGDLPGSDPSLHRVSSRRADLGFERDRLLERLEAARARVAEATEEAGRALRGWQAVHGGLPDVDGEGRAVLEPESESEEDGGDRDAEVEAVDEELDDPRAEALARIEEIDRALLPLAALARDAVERALEAAAGGAPGVADDAGADAVDGPSEEAQAEEAPDEDEGEGGDDPDTELAADAPDAPDADGAGAESEALELELAGPLFPPAPPDPFAEPSEPIFRGMTAAPFDEDPDPVVVAGRLRVAEARRALTAAQASQRSHTARHELVEELEHAHAEVVEAHHRDRFGRSRHKVEEARLAEQRVLDQLGFPSYTAFVLSAGAIRGGDDDTEVAEAEAALNRAQAELERIVADRAAERTDVELEPGPGSLDPATTPEVDAGDLDGEGAAQDGGEEAEDLTAAEDLSELQLALAEVGLVFEDGFADRAALVALARSWLDEQEAATARREALLAERTELEELIAELPDPNRPPEPHSEVSALAMAESDLLAAEAEVSGITTRLEEIADETKDVLAEEEAETDVVFEPAMTPEQRVDDVTWYISTRLAALRGVGDGIVLPIVFDEPFVDFESHDAISLMRSVEPFGGALQIVLLTDDQALIDWAEGLGTERGWVVGAGA